jgi:hypothetical protein
VGFSPPMDPQNLSIEDERNSHLEAQVSNEFVLSLSPVVYVIMMALKCKTSNEIWTKLEEIFGGSTSLEIDQLPKELILTSNNEELQIASTSDCGNDPMPSISPTCDMTGGNDLVSTKMTCNSGNAIYTDDSSSTVYNGVDT